MKKILNFGIVTFALAGGWVVIGLFGGVMPQDRVQEFVEYWDKYKAKVWLWFHRHPAAAKQQPPATPAQREFRLFLLGLGIGVLLGLMVFLPVGYFLK